MKSFNIFKGLLLSLVFIAGCTDEVQEIILEKFPDGSVKSEKLIKMVKGQEVMIRETFYFPNHNKQYESEFLNAETVRITVWYESGGKWTETIYVNNQKNGLHTTWYENGYKRYEGLYKDGGKTGTWVFYNKSGSVLKEMQTD